MNKKYNGIGASSGVAIAKALKIETEEVKITNDFTSTDKELKSLDDSMKKTIKQLEVIKIKAEKNMGAEEAMVFDAHIQIVSDPMMKDEMTALINESKSALFSVDNITKKYHDMFASMDDEYMRARAADVLDIAKRWINNIVGIESVDLSSLNSEVIIVGDDITPSETAQMDKKFVKGFVTNVGGRTSHAAIMARSLEIPAILGLKDILENVKNNDILAIDGDEGQVLINPSPAEIEEFKKRAVELKNEKAESLKFIGKESVSKDGHHVELVANIGSPKDATILKGFDAEGVGLFRSEFLYMDSKDWPTEDEQFESYKKVLEVMEGKLVVVRTLDIGGDKTLEYYKFPEEMNPFLGYRAIRFCLDNIEIFKTQLRALARASVFGKLAIMFPMIATIDEFKQAKKVFLDVVKELKKAGTKVSDDIQLGMMVEIPAAAASAKQFAKHADFFSIGTNDLMQYTMASDRMNEKVSYLYQPLNPSILSLIKMTIDGAHAEGKWVGMCGEMASDKHAIPVLLGLGLDEFSMSATAILSTRRQLSTIDYKKAQELAKKALECDSQSDVLELVTEFNKH